VVRPLVGIVLAGSLAGCDVVFRVDELEYRDAAVDAPACVGYEEIIVGAPSRYRIITEEQDLFSHLDTCRADRAHLVALDTSGEMQAITAHRSDPGVERYWVGAFQATAQLTPVAGWRLITGEDLPPGLWALAQPNDGDGVESDAENFAAIELAEKRLRDHHSAQLNGAVCECDGKPEMLPP
jgi:hypothetical protein